MTPGKFLYIFYLFLFTFYSLSQSLYIPSEFRNAYENGTRSPDGKPGSEYWQNKSVYNIDATVIPSTRTIKATEKILYHNNSPDTLDKIVIRVYQNINRPGNSRSGVYDEKFFTKGMEFSALSINGKNYEITDTLIEDLGTNLVIKNLSIKPDSDTKINIAWQFEVQAGNFIRMGAYDSTVFFIAYWYPQVAVYDDIYGWDMVPYTGNTEFYNDFNDYDIKITLPNNFGVWATGRLENPAEMLAPKVYLRYEKAQKSEQIIKIISTSDYNDAAVFNNNKNTNTWHFSAKNLPDFTFGLSSHYLWDGKSVYDGSKNVFVSAVYDQGSLQFYDVCDAAVTTVHMLSYHLPGVPFPFPKITLFDGGGGMEYPMMVNQSLGNERIWMVYVTVHEVAHSYFPFYMGINEHNYAWMDEGWAQMLSEPIQLSLDTTIDFRQRNINRYLTEAGKFENVPPMTPSYMVNGEAYANASYFRPCAAYNILRDMLDSKTSGLFETALKEYINRWHGKHPTPYDFFFTFEDVTKEDLSWFWEPWFFEMGYPDLEIDSVISDGDKIKIHINKPGELPVPVYLEVRVSDGSVINIQKQADVWKGGDDDIWIEEVLNGKKVNSVYLGNKYIPDADKSNNEWILK